MKKILYTFCLALLLIICASVYSQTTINGGRASLGLVNYSGATHTLPTVVVASTGALPASGCTPGELAIVTGATLGQQLYENSGTGTCVWTQQLNSGSSSGGGITVYSATSVTVTAATYYFPIGGGGSPSATESDVDVDSPAAATITNFYVQLSVALGGGNSGVFTLRKNAGSQSVTCTISGASATTCNDTTHSFSVSQGDLLTVQLVTTGTISVTPNIVYTMQFGNITASGTVNSGTSGQLGMYNTTGSSISGETMSQDCTITNTGVITCTKTNNVAFATSATTDTTNAANISSGLLGNEHYYGILGASVVTTSETRNSATFAALTTADTVTFNLASSTNVVATFESQCSNDVPSGAQENQMQFIVDSSQITATKQLEDSNDAGFIHSCHATYSANLGSGSHTIAMQYATLAGTSTGTWSQRRLMIFATP